MDIQCQVRVCGGHSVSGEGPHSLCAALTLELLTLVLYTRNLPVNVLRLELTDLRWNSTLRSCLVCSWGGLLGPFGTSLATFGYSPAQRTAFRSFSLPDLKSNVTMATNSNSN